MISGSPLSVVGLMLTLAGLLGSFFYIQLSDWLRSILALDQKIQLNRRQGEDNQKRAIVECRVEFRRLAGWHNYLVNFFVIFFVLYVMWLSFGMISLAAGDPLYPYVRKALIVFVCVFTLLSGILLAVGVSRAWSIKRILDGLD